MTAETFVHALAAVEPGARLGAGVRIGPFCHVEGNAVLHDGVELVSHVSVRGDTTIGAGTRVFPYAALGGPPQDLKYKGSRTRLTIGSNCQIRENVTANIGTETGPGHTIVGDNCFFMAGTHIAHDADIGNNVITAPFAVFGGHCIVGDNVVMSSLAAIHQFVRIGRGAMIGGGAMVVGDVIPFGLVQGDRATLRGLNVVGLRRAGVSRAELGELRRAYLMLFDRARPVAENVGRVRESFAGQVRVAEILDFIDGRKKRIFTVPALADRAEAGADGAGETGE